MLNAPTSSALLDNQLPNERNFADIRYLPIYYQNVRSIPAKTDLRSRIHSALYKVLCFTETWLHSQHDDDRYFPQNFIVYRKDRPTLGGGVAILVHREFKSYQIEQIDDPDCESVTVKISLEPMALVIYVAYINDCMTQNILLKHYQLIQKLTNLECDSRIMVLGDFNLHNVKWSLDESDTHYLPHNMAQHRESTYFQTASEFLQKMQDLPMYQLSNAQNVASNVLDLLFVNGTDDVQVCTAPVAITKLNEVDKFHPSLEISYEHRIGTSPSSPINTAEIYSFKDGNYDCMSQQLEAINFAEVFDRMDIDSAFDYFYEMLNRLIIENVPTVHIRQNSNRPKWWTREWQRLKNKRNKAYKRKPKNEMTDEYTEALKNFNELDEKLNKEYIDRIQEEILENPSEFWTYARSTKKTSMYPREMQFGARTSDEPQQIVEMFADYFESLYVKDDEQIVFDEEYGEELDDVWNVKLSMLDIENGIRELDARSSAGPDNISPIVVKKCADAFIWPLWILHEKSMESGKIASKLKISRVVPVVPQEKRKKDGNRELPDNCNKFGVYANIRECNENQAEWSR